MARIGRINPTGITSQTAPMAKGAGDGFKALSEMARITGDFLKPAALKQASEEGTRAVYRDEDGSLKVDEKSVFAGEMGQAHNAAAYSSFLAQKKIDISDTFAELGRQHQYDPAAFKDAADAYVSALREEEGVPQLLREDIANSAMSEASSRFNGLLNGETQRTHNNDNRNTSAYRDMLIQDYTNLYAAGNVEEAEAKLREIEAISEYRASAPYISEAEGDALNVMRAVRSTAKLARLARQVEDADTDEEREDLGAAYDELLKDDDMDAAARQMLYSSNQARLKGLDASAIVDSLTDDSVIGAVNRQSGGFDWSKHRTQGGLRGDAISGMDDGFREGLESLISSAPPEIKEGLQVYSGFRSVALQSDLFDKEIKKRGSVAEARRHVAPPGRSNHNHGKAADLKWKGQRLDYAPAEVREWIHANAGDHGLHFPLGHEPWHVEPLGTRGTSQNTRLMGNRDGLSKMGVSITPANEYLAMQMGVEQTAAISEADPGAALSDVLGADVMEANPRFKDMTVMDLRNDAARAVVLKATDIAKQRLQISEIADDEVRGLALKRLNETYLNRQSLEAVAEEDITARLEQGEAITEQEIRSNHDLSDEAQNKIVDKLQTAMKATNEISSTLLDLGNPDAAMDYRDAGRVNDAFDAITEGKDLLGPESISASSLILGRTGRLPEGFVNGALGAIRSGDAERAAIALESMAQFTAENPGAYAGITGQKAITDALADYKFFGKFMGPQEAATQAAALQSGDAKDRLKNMSDEAKTAAKELAPEDFVDHLSRKGVEVELGTPGQQGVLMENYRELFEKAYAETGNTDLARNRALTTMDRIYGPSGIGGSTKLMMHPPTSYYARQNGSHDWMEAQIREEVRDFFGEEEDWSKSPIAAIVEMFGGDDVPLSSIDDAGIVLVSDNMTEARVKAGQPPVYKVFYEVDGNLQELPDYFEFLPMQGPPDRVTPRREFDEARRDAMVQGAMDKRRIDGTRDASNWSGRLGMNLFPDEE